MDWSPKEIVSVSVIVLVTISLLITSFIISKRPYKLAYLARTERGTIEKATTITWAAAAMACLLFTHRKERWKGYSCTFLLVTLMLRELDFHSRFTDHHITSLSYWRSMHIPMGEKLIVLCIVLILAANLCFFVKTAFSQFAQDLRKREPYALTILGSLAYVALSLFLDAVIDVGRLNRPFYLFLSIFEESIELGIPILVMLALIQWIFGQAMRTRGQTSPQDLGK